jgi:hypothetical protein
MSEVGAIGSVSLDYLERTKLELARAVVASRIVELRTASQFREYKPDQLTPGPFSSLVDADGNGTACLVGSASTGEDSSKCCLRIYALSWCVATPIRRPS